MTHLKTDHTSSERARPSFKRLANAKVGFLSSEFATESRWEAARDVENARTATGPGRETAEVAAPRANEVNLSDAILAVLLDQCDSNSAMSKAGVKKGAGGRDGGESS